MTLDDLRNRPVHGRLKIPLGAEALLRGTVEFVEAAPGSKISEHLVFAVTHVNGGALAEAPVRFKLRCYNRGTATKASPVVGRTIDLVVYEGGGFRGERAPATTARPIQPFLPCEGDFELPVLPPLAAGPRPGYSFGTWLVVLGVPVRSDLEASRNPSVDESATPAD